MPDLSQRDLVARHVAQPIVLFRIVHGSSRGAYGVLESFQSNYERGTPPRGLEVDSALIQMGLSMFTTFEAARERAQRWPKLGTHIARVQLEPGSGFNVAETGPRGHRTVWGRPLQLLDCVTDILPVGVL